MCTSLQSAMENLHLQKFPIIPAAFYWKVETWEAFMSQDVYYWYYENFFAQNKKFAWKLVCEIPSSLATLSWNVANEIQ